MDETISYDLDIITRAIEVFHMGSVRVRRAANVVQDFVRILSLIEPRLLPC